MKRSEDVSNLTVVLFLISALFIAIGWIFNLVKIFKHTGDMTGELFVRIIGVFVFIIGGIAGWF